MKNIKLALASFMLLLITSCSSMLGVSSEDINVLAEGVVSLQASHIELAESYKDTISRAEGISKDEKDKFIAGVDVELKNYMQLSISIIETLRTMGDLDWDKLAVEMLKKGRNVYDSFKEHFGDLL